MKTKNFHWEETSCEKEFFCFFPIESNHLGNVLQVLTDRKLAIDDGEYDLETYTYTSVTPDGIIDYFTADVVSQSDYYPFGMMLPGRNESGDYRYGFQNQETDDEIKGEGNSVNYKYRMHDPRVGRFFAVDPMTSRYPWNSPYAFSENKVIHKIELEGLESETPDLLEGELGPNGEIYAPVQQRVIRKIQARQLISSLEFEYLTTDPCYKYVCQNCITSIGDLDFWVSGTQGSAPIALEYVVPKSELRPTWDVQKMQQRKVSTIPIIFDTPKLELPDEEEERPNWVDINSPNAITNMDSDGSGYNLDDVKRGSLVFSDLINVADQIINTGVTNVVINMEVSVNTGSPVAGKLYSAWESSSTAQSVVDALYKLGVSKKVNITVNIDAGYTTGTPGHDSTIITAN